MGRGALLAAAVVLSAAALSAAAFPYGAPSGAGTFDARERGCYCHAPDPSPAVGFVVTGLPGDYAPGTNYTVEISVTFTDVAATVNRSQGGFFIEATAGSFAPAEGFEGLVQVRGLAASQTANGSMTRSWRLIWTAPEIDGLEVTFYVFVNTVNGNRSETFGTDHWTMKTVRIGLGVEPVVTGPPPRSPPFALETYGVLVLASVFGAYALYTFYRARKPASKDSPDSRATASRRRRPRP